MPKLSGTWQARDIILILGLVNLSLFLLETNKKLYYAFLTILIINNFFIIIESSNHLLKHGKFKIDNINQTEVKFLNDINRSLNIIRVKKI